VPLTARIRMTSSRSRAQKKGCTPPAHNTGTGTNAVQDCTTPKWTQPLPPTWMLLM
jgi:hypothetical protein